MEQASTLKPRTAYDLLGGNSAVRQVVDRFYDFMAGDPQYRELRALHAADLDPMRASLTGFLAAWLGGPKDWFEDHPGLCMMSAHRDVRITQETARQWADAMSRAVHDSPIDTEIAHKLAQALSATALGMACAPASPR